MLKKEQKNWKKVQAGKKQPKNHVRKHSTYTWDKSALEEEAITWNDETVVNWSEVGTRFDIRR